MNYEIKYTEKAEKHLEYFIYSGNKAVLRKIDTLIDELKEHPFEGTGKPELLKYALSGLWSRRINKEHRLVYLVENDIITVVVISMKGHYDNQ